MPCFPGVELNQTLFISCLFSPSLNIWKVSNVEREVWSWVLFKYWIDPGLCVQINGAGNNSRLCTTPPKVWQLQWKFSVCLWACCACCSSLTINYLQGFAVVKVSGCCFIRCSLVHDWTFWKRRLLPGHGLILVTKDEPALPQRLHEHRYLGILIFSCHFQCWGLSRLISVPKELDRIGICRFCSYKTGPGSFLISEMSDITLLISQISEGKREKSVRKCGIYHNQLNILDLTRIRNLQHVNRIINYIRYCLWRFLVLLLQSVNYFVGSAEKLSHSMVKLPGKTGSEHNENHVILMHL